MNSIQSDFISVKKGGSTIYKDMWMNTHVHTHIHTHTHTHIRKFLTLGKQFLKTFTRNWPKNPLFTKINEN